MAGPCVYCKLKPRSASQQTPLSSANIASFACNMSGRGASSEACGSTVTDDSSIDPNWSSCPLRSHVHVHVHVPCPTPRHFSRPHTRPLLTLHLRPVFSCGVRLRSYSAYRAYVFQPTSTSYVQRAIPHSTFYPRPTSQLARPTIQAQRHLSLVPLLTATFPLP